MTERKNTSIDDLFEALDRMAIELLDRLSGEDIKDGVIMERVCLTDQTKVFGELVDYAALRGKLSPPKDPRSDKFLAMKERFDARGATGGKAGGRDRGSPAEAFAGEGGSA